jgi:hypothetical protein
MAGNPYVVAGKNRGARLINLQKPWRRIRAKANLADVRIHDLRHSFASVAAGTGMSLPTIGKLLGHSQPATTARYAHLAADPIRTASNLIGAEISAAMSGQEAHLAHRRLRPRIPKVWPARPVGTLRALLPITALRLQCHSFELLRHPGPDPRLPSRIVMVGSQAANPWPILARHGAELGRYSITRAEIAFDAEAGSIEAAREGLFALVGQLSKRRHQRGHIFSVHKPDDRPKIGCVAEPSFYLEGRKGSVGLKCYARHQKRPGGVFGGLCVRLEWTLTGKPALERHLGGNQIDHLAKADLNAFLKRNLRLERVDHAALGKLLFPPRPIPPKTQAPMNDPDYRAKRAAVHALQLLAARELGKFGDWDAAWKTCWESPAQIRGYLRSLRDRQRRRKRGRRGRPKGKSRYRPITDFRPITNYRIDACFRRIELMPVTSAGIIISAQPKSLTTTAGNSSACTLKFIRTPAPDLAHIP